MEDAVRKNGIWTSFSHTTDDMLRGGDKLCTNGRRECDNIHTLIEDWEDMLKKLELEEKTIFEPDWKIGKPFLEEMVIKLELDHSTWPFDGTLGFPGEGPHCMESKIVDLM